MCIYTTWWSIQGAEIYDEIHAYFIYTFMLKFIHVPGKIDQLHVFFFTSQFLRQRPADPAVLCW